MPIHLITGIPGHGKTNRMVGMIRAAAKKADRPIFAAGVDGLEPGMAQPLPDPTRWRDCPDGSIIFVDEAWKWFGHLSNASRQQTPAHVLDLAEHRHHGIDFVWTAQGPNQIYPFARPLIEQHWHCLRKFGTNMVEIYKWGELVEDVKSQGNRDRAEKEITTLDTSVYGLYKSASEHTIKARLPWKIWLIPLTAVVGAVLAWYAWKALSPDAMAENLTGRPASGVAAAGPATRSSKRTSEAEPPMTAEQWLERLQARFPGLHGSAPAFDAREVVSVPRRYCVITQIETGDRCRCFTEQVTPLEVSRSQCLHVARWGEYDHFRAPPEPGSPGEGYQQEPEPPRGAPAGTGSAPGEVGSPGQGAVWGAMPDTLRASGG